LSRDELRYSPKSYGTMVLFEHDPTPEDEHAGFLLYGMEPTRVAQLLNRAAEE